jgi:hypothetical protein
MGVEKKNKEALEELIMNCGAINECTMHQGCTFIESESLAYASATNAHKEGSFDYCTRSQLMDEVKDYLAMVPYSCVMCNE